MKAGDVLKCERCDYEWMQKRDEEPKTCAKCKSPYWKKPMTDYWKSLREKRDE